MSPSPVRFHIAVAVILMALGASSTDARAQAWVGEKGGLDLGLDYNLGISDKVIPDEGMDFIDAGTTTHQLTLGAEYVPVPRLAVNVSLPFVALKYTGNRTAYPHAGGGSYDDGDTHTTLTDLRAGVRYQVLQGPLALSPHVATSIPVADYETVGNTVAGRHLKALHLGLGVGTVIGAATYVHLMYEFSLVEKYKKDGIPELAEYGQNRSDVAFTVGHKLLDQRLDLHIDANARLTHGGMNFSEFYAVPQGVLDNHDPVLKEDIILVGGGVGYQISNSLGVSLSGRAFVAGANTQNANVLAFGVSWSPLP